MLPSYVNMKHLNCSQQFYTISYNLQKAKCSIVTLSNVSLSKKNKVKL